MLKDKKDLIAAFGSKELYDDAKICNEVREADKTFPQSIIHDLIRWFPVLYILGARPRMYASPTLNSYRQTKVFQVRRALIGWEPVPIVVLPH